MRSLLLATAWLGALAALAAGRPWLLLVVAAGTIAASLTAYRGRRGVFLALAALGVIALAALAWRRATAPPPGDSVAWWADGERHVLTGRIESEPEPRGATERFVIAARAIESDAGPVAASGGVQVRVPATSRYRAGDVVRIEGRLEEPPALDGFDYRAYLARRDVYAVMDYPRVRVMAHEASGWPRRGLEMVHARARDALWTTLPAAQAGLAEGILLGRRADIPRDVNDDFNRGGVSHLIVISGYNIAVLGALVVATTGWLAGRRRAGVAALAAIWLYCAFVGFSPPVARAAVMGSFAVLAMLSGRPYGGGTALVLAAAALTVQDPRILEDVSFQLSFAATAGLVVLGGPLTALGRRVFSEEQSPAGVTWRSLAVAIWDTLAVTLAASLATTPILLATFGRLSLVSPLTNLLLVPLFPAVLAAGTAGLGAAIAAPGVAGLALAPLAGLLDLSIWVARSCAALPGASARVDWFSPWMAIAAYAALAVAAFARFPRAALDLRATTLHPPVPLLARPVPILAFAPAAILALSLAPAALRPAAPTAESRVEVANVAGTPVAVVNLAGGGRVLVDTGLPPRAARQLLDRSHASVGGGLQAVIVTRDAPSAYAGLAEVIGRFHPRVVLVPPEALDTWWAREARAGGATVLPLHAGLTLGNARAHVEVAPAAAATWAVTVRHGARTIGLAGDGRDAGVAKRGRELFVYGMAGGGILRREIEANAAAMLSTDGVRIRLPARARHPYRFEPCADGCRAGRGRD